MRYAYTGLRYLQRKHFLPTRVLHGRFQLNWMDTFRHSVRLPIVPKKVENNSNVVTTEWVEPVV